MDRASVAGSPAEHEPGTAAVTDAASGAGVTGTPTVKVNGTTIDNTADALRAAVAPAK